MAIALCVNGAGAAVAQTPADDARCDSIVAAAKVDSVEVGIFLSIRRIDGGDLPDTKTLIMGDHIRSSFVPPSPFRVTTFSGPSRMRTLRTLLADSASELRAPDVTGIYRFTATKGQRPSKVITVRWSLIHGLDSAVAAAIASEMTNASVFSPPDGEDSMRVEVRLVSDSLAGARRIISGSFPRMPVIDAVPMRDNPAPPFPEDAKADSVTSGEVVLRFVVARSGEPELETVELIRASGTSFLRSALESLSKQRFRPATIRGCPVAQRIDYPFTFVVP